MFIQAALVFLCFALYKPKKAGKTEQDTYQPPFYCNFDFTCLVSKRVPGYKETDPDVQFVDNAYNL